MATKTIGIILNGATGRICSTQHSSQCAVADPRRGRAAGRRRPHRAAPAAGRPRCRSPRRRRATHGIADWTTDLDAALADPTYAIFFDAAATHQRAARAHQGDRRRQAHLHREAGGAVRRRGAAPCCARPRRAASSTARSRTRSICRACRSSPQLDARAACSAASSASGWNSAGGCSTASSGPCQRPSWNYRRAGGGGLILDM